MNKNLLLFLLTITTLLACRSTEKNETPLFRACTYLWSQQAEDGGWHSETHGIMRGGEAMTAYVLWTLLEVPEATFARSEIQVNKALAFLRKRLHKDGMLGHYDPDILDYPNYATAYAIRIFAKYGTDRDTKLVTEMAAYLAQQQFTEQRGISPTHPAYGAWGFGELNLAAGTTGHVDLSHTRRILQAFRAINWKNDKLYKDAYFFLNKVQKQDLPEYFDGGFYASAVTLGTNKSDTLAGFSQRYGSYASATADGLLGLLAAGSTPDSKEVQSALSWLLENDDMMYPAGIPTNTAEAWHEVLFYYHLAVRAEAYTALQIRGDWKMKMSSILEKKQDKNGSFSNIYGAANKEDDPLIATAYVLTILK